METPSGIRTRYQKAISVSLTRVRDGSDADIELWNLLLYSLTEQEARAFNIVNELIGGATSAHVAAALQTSINNASTILNRLWQLGLTRREKVVTDEGRHYVYEPNYTIRPVKEMPR